MFSFLSSWNHLLYVWVLGRDDSVITVPAGVLTLYLGHNMFYYYADAGAAVVIASLPIAVVFLLLQKHFVAGLTAGAVKG